MAGGQRILSIDGARNADVSSDNSLQVLLYDGQGNPLCMLDDAPFDATKQRGIISMGRDYKLARMQRASPDGTLRSGAQACLFYDSIEGTSLDTNKWVSSNTTMAQSQAAGTGTLFNSGSTAATSTNVQNVTHRFFPFIGRSGLVFRTKVRHGAHFNNNLIESGFGSPTGSQQQFVVNGAIWRKRDTDGAYQPVVCVGSVEVLGTAVPNATFLASVLATDYFFQEIFLEESRATFRMITQAGALINEQVIDFGTTIGTFTQTHMQVCHRMQNTGATGTAVQFWIAQTNVWLADSIGPDYATIQTQLNYGSLTDPTAYTQNANYANSAAPVSATLSNTAAGYSKLGGQWQFAAVGGAETDYAIFALAIPSPYAFVCTGVRISAFNTVVAVATTATLLQWGLGFNSSAVSLATAGSYPYMRKAIGFHSFPIGAAVGASGGNDVVWQGRETTQPGRFFSIILKVPIGTATATEIFRGTCNVEGYFE